MIFNINSTRGQTRFLTCVVRVTCLVIIISLTCVLYVEVPACPHQRMLLSIITKFSIHLMQTLLILNTLHNIMSVDVDLSKFNTVSIYKRQQC